MQLWANIGKANATIHRQQRKNSLATHDRFYITPIVKQYASNDTFRPSIEIFIILMRVKNTYFHINGALLFAKSGGKISSLELTNSILN